MEKFTTLNAVAAPLDIVNIDTDMIIPKQFLKTITRTGLGQFAFHELRTHDDGTPKADFILNRSPFDKAKILVAGANFGCGSSREHAPWALSDSGIRCVIAPSFADIFYNNCFENAILPAIVLQSDCDKIFDFLNHSQDKIISVSLINREILCGDISIKFQIDDFSAKRLLDGLDTIGLTLINEQKIVDFEKNRHLQFPWL
jgi:3-isopropylmalate/(R)-2-methylmalate dehydratase small subunit